MIALIIAYTILVVAVALYSRKHSSGDEYVMGGRNASSPYIAAALFTLIGGGELVTLTTLAFVYGAGGISLFLGYGLAFAFLGIFAGRIRRSRLERFSVSLPDYAHARFGTAVGRLVFGVSWISFFALLMLQFSAAGQLLAPALGIPYEAAVVGMGSLCLAYLLIGGFKTVLATDLIQGVAMFILMIIVLIAVLMFKPAEAPQLMESPEEHLPLASWLSITITGFFVGATSADVWQRLYAAKDNRTVRLGFGMGGVLLLLFGGLLVLLGVVAKSSGLIDNPDLAFQQAIDLMLPEWAAALAGFLVFVTVISTADTELFLLAGLVEKERRRTVKDQSEEVVAQRVTTKSTRTLLLLVAVVSIVLAIAFDDLIVLYTWLLSAILTIAVPLLLSFFILPNRIAAFVSMLASLIAFTILATGGLLTLETSYYILLPGALLYGLLHLLLPPSKPTPADLTKSS